MERPDDDHEYQLGPWREYADYLEKENDKLKTTIRRLNDRMDRYMNDADTTEER